MAEATAPSLIPVAIEDEMRQAYLDYSMSVIVGRALPDVRDGLKPVHRRILYAMFEQGMLHNRRYSKCAGTVGEVLKKYHPHGDASVYDALVRLAQEWNLRALLVDGQGNFGSIDGDSAAAYRETESRLTKLAEAMLAGERARRQDWPPRHRRQRDGLPAQQGPGHPEHGAAGEAAEAPGHRRPARRVESAGHPRGGGDHARRGRRRGPEQPVPA